MNTTCEAVETIFNTSKSTDKALKMLYADVETLRRESETYEVPAFRQSNLEKNCGQIFAKGPALTIDFLEKMNADIVPKKTYLFGHTLNTKKILFASGLFLLFFISFFGVVVMWLTDFFDNTVLSTLEISNSSENFEMWKKPTPKTTIKFFLFNYTNVEDFENKLVSKLHVQELGPYAYEESLERVNVVFNDDDTVSYQERRTFKFLPYLSNRKQSDRVIVPNIPLLAGAAKTKYMNYFTRLSFSAALSAMGEKTFINLAADSYITGYPSNLYDVSKSLAKMNEEVYPEKIGLLSGKSGVQPNVYTMNTGKIDLNRLGLVEKVNGKNLFDYWSTDECNSVKGSDGALFPPKLVQHNQPLSYILPQMCRTIPFIFDKELTILEGKVPAYRYVVPEDLYDSAEEIPEHQCYCNMDSGVCPLKGVFNVTPCSMGAPMFVSHPHFYRADKSLFEGVSGLSSAKRDVRSYVNVHPTMGFSMSGKTRAQMNIQVQKAFSVYQLDRYKDGLMLPIAWFEGELDEKTLPQDFLDIIYDATYTLKGVKLAFRWGFLLTMLITIVCIVLTFKSKWRKISPNRSSIRPLQRRQDNNLEEL